MGVATDFPGSDSVCKEFNEMVIQQLSGLAIGDITNQKH